MPLQTGCSRLGVPKMSGSVTVSAALCSVLVSAKEDIFEPQGHQLKNLKKIVTYLFYKKYLQLTMGKILSTLRAALSLDHCLPPTNFHSVP